MARPTLFVNRKLRKLAQRLRSKALAVGSLELIWHQANETGDPIVGDVDDVEGAADWRGERGELVAALVDCGTAGGPGFLVPREGGQYEVHDYWHHAPDYVRKRAARESNRRENGEKLKRADQKRDRSEAQHIDKSDRSLDGQRPPSPDCLAGDGRTPAPAPSPAPAREEGSVRGSPPEDDSKVAKLPRGKGSRRCPADFELDLQYAVEQIPDIDAKAEAARFKDFEFRTPHSDWAATWRNWIRTCKETGRYARAQRIDFR